MLRRVGALRPVPAPGLAILALVSGAVFAGVTLLYKAGALRQLDAMVAESVRSTRSQSLDALGSIDERIFSSSWAFAIALALAAVLWLRGPRWSWVTPMFIGVSALIDLGSRQGFAVFLHPRQLAQAIQIILTGGHVSGLGAYPSGHAERADFLAVLFVAFLPRPIGIPLALFAATTMFSRVYTFAHRPSEVLGGAALGICVGAFALWLAEILRSSGWLEQVRLARGMA